MARLNNGGLIGAPNSSSYISSTGIYGINDNNYLQKSGLWAPNYYTLNFTTSAGVTATNNNTKSVTLSKTGGTNQAWDQQAYTAQGYTAPLTLEFYKTASVTDDSVSYAMIGLNTDPTTNASYDTIDHAAYPYRQDNYQVYNNGAQSSWAAWSSAQKIYIVYSTDGTIKHYNGSTLLYTASYGTNNTVYIDTSFYNVNSLNCRFIDIRLTNKLWDGFFYS